MERPAEVGPDIAALDELVAASTISIDRPRGARHPRFGHARYPLDYGYLEGTTSGDGDGIDVFVGAGVVGAVLSLDAVKRDLEAKLLLDCSAAEAHLAVAFLRDELTLACLLVRRPG